MFTVFKKKLKNSWNLQKIKTTFCEISSPITLLLSNTWLWKFACTKKQKGSSNFLYFGGYFAYVEIYDFWKKATWQPI